MCVKSIITGMAMGFIVVNGPVAAQTAAPVQPCGQVATASGTTVQSISVCTDELLLAQSNLIDEVEGLVVEMQAINVSAYVAKRPYLAQAVMNDDLSAKLQSLRDEHGRGKAARDAVEETDYEEAFEKADKKKGKDCSFSDMPFKDSLGGELPPGLKPVNGSTLDDLDARFGDGKCNVFKARIDDPGGVDDGKIIQVHERRENMCETVCDDRQNPSSGNHHKKDRKDRAAARLTDGIAATVRATENISQARYRLASLRMQMQSGEFRQIASVDVCVSDADPSAGFEIAATAVSIAQSAVSFASIIAGTVKDSVEPPANQSVAGFNVSSTLVPFAVVEGISLTIEEILSAAEKALVLTGQIMAVNRTDTIETCLRSVRDEAVEMKTNALILRNELFAPMLCEGGTNNASPCASIDDCPGGTCEGGAITKLQVSAGDTNAALQSMQNEIAYMKLLLEDNNDLLNTPPGKRPGYNSRSGSGGTP